MGCNSTKDALTPVAPESKSQSSGPQLMYSPQGGGPDKTFISLHQNAKDIPLIDAEEADNTTNFSDIDLDDPETEKAATKIQAVFRGHKTRKEIEDTMKTGDDETQNFEQEFSADDKELCHAATKIQATFRGHAARKQTEANKKEEDELSKELEKLDPKDELADIDLSDPDLHKAATKIQASFRGHKVRKEVDPAADSESAEQD